MTDSMKCSVGRDGGKPPPGRWRCSGNGSSRRRPLRGRAKNRWNCLSYAARWAREVEVVGLYMVGTRARC